MNKPRRTYLTVILTLILTLCFSSSIMAFSDLSKVPEQNKITELHDDGVINGVGNDLFAPDEDITYGQAVQIIVKGLGLNIDNMRFIKKPEASDSFDRVPNDAWYADAFIIAHFNGLSLTRGVDPEQSITREAYTNLLAEAIWRLGDYAFIEMWIEIKDESDINPDYMNNIQKLLIAKIAHLDAQGRFLPKREITRAEAAVMLYDARAFVKDHTPLPQRPDAPSQEKVTLSVDTMNSDVQKLTLSWGTKPNPGYTLSIDRIDFTVDGKAIVYYSLHYPEPNKSYPAVRSEPTAVTYVSAKLTPEIMQTK